MLREWYTRGAPLHQFFEFFPSICKIIGMPFYNLLSIQWECVDGTVQIKLDLMPSVCGWVRSRGRNFP